MRYEAQIEISEPGKAKGTVGGSSRLSNSSDMRYGGPQVESCMLRGGSRVNRHKSNLGLNQCCSGSRLLPQPLPLDNGEVQGYFGRVTENIRRCQTKPHWSKDMPRA